MVDNVGGQKLGHWVDGQPSSTAIPGSRAVLGPEIMDLEKVFIL